MAAVLVVIVVKLTVPDSRETDTPGRYDPEILHRRALGSSLWHATAPAPSYHAGIGQRQRGRGRRRAIGCRVEHGGPMLLEAFSSTAPESVCVLRDCSVDIIRFV